MNFKRLTILIFVIGVLLRLSLSLVNYDANDDHFSVINIIASENRIPESAECWECFQPKLFHFFIASVLKTLSIQKLGNAYKIGQAITCLSGILTLVVVLLFLSSLNFTEFAKFFGFTLVALNPKLIGINAQLTNDSFVILFVSVSLYYALEYFKKPMCKKFVLMMLFVLLSALTKGNGLVLLPIILSMFLYVIIFRDRQSKLQKKHYLVAMIVFLISYVCLVPVLGQYWQKYQLYGSPFVTNIEKKPLPKLIEKTYAGRPGITSIVDSYLTFRITDLFANPVISHEFDNYPTHRTSLWSQLYGSANFVHFSNWPETWKSEHMIDLNTGRLIFLLALVPAGLFLFGFVRNFVKIVKHVRMREFHSVVTERLLFFIGTCGFFLFIISYTMQYRDFSTMKAIFIFPGLLCLIYQLLSGIDCYNGLLILRNKWTCCINGSFIVLSALYCFNIIRLIVQLA